MTVSLYSRNCHNILSQLYFNKKNQNREVRPLKNWFLESQTFFRKYSFITKRQYCWVPTMWFYNLHGYWPKSWLSNLWGGRVQLHQQSVLILSVSLWRINESECLTQKLGLIYFFFFSKKLFIYILRIFHFILPENGSQDSLSIP